MFDVTDSRSFDDAANWMKEVQKAADPSCKFLIMANKCDFTNKYPRMNQVPNTKVEDFIKSQKILYFGESSAKKNLNIEKPINKSSINFGDSSGSSPCTLNIISWFNSSFL